MAADISPFIDRLNRIKQALEQQEGNIAIQLSLSVKALANRNIVDRGFGEVYSNNEIPVFYFRDSTINAGGDNYIKKQKKSKSKGGNNSKGNWKGLRQAEGLQVAHVDLTHSGQMWRGIVPLPPLKQGTVTIAPLGGTNREVQKEMNYNHERYGNFIGKALTADNITTLNQLGGDLVNNVIQSVI